MEKLDEQGWLLSPDEDPVSLLKRKDLVAQQDNKNPSFLEKGAGITWSLFRFRLTEVPIIISNKSLSPWQGAVLWECATDNKESFPLIQVREKLSPEKEEEVLAHELVHAARFAFKEPFFEEILAYKTAKQGWRRFFGPLFIFQIEPIIWIAAILIGMVGFAFFSSVFCFWLPYGFLGVLLLRLFVLQGVFSLAQYKLKKAGMHLHALSILCRMSDKEIIGTAFSSPLALRKKILAKQKEGRMPRFT